MGPGVVSTYVDLLVCPAIHAERLDLGDVCAQLSMDRSTAHAEKDAQLNIVR